MTKPKKEIEATRELAKQILGILDFDDSKEESLSEEDITNRAFDADLFYKKWFKRFLAKLTYEHLKQMGSEAVTPVMMSFHNGILFGFQIIDDWFKVQSNIVGEEMTKALKKEEPETGIPTIGENPIE